MHTLADISRVLEQARRERKLTYEELGQAAGLSRVATANVVQGGAAPKVTTLMSLADKLGLELVLVPKQVADALQPQQDTPRPMSIVERRMRAAVSESKGEWATQSARGTAPKASSDAPAAPPKRMTRIRRPE